MENKMENTLNSVITNITHVIFDCDGTLINTTDFVPDILDYIIGQLGEDSRPSDMDDTIRRLRQASNGPDYGRAVANAFNNALDRQTLRTLLSEAMEQQNSKVKLMSGVEKLILHLFKHNIPMAVATGGAVSHYEQKTKMLSYLLNVGNFLSHLVCSDEDTEVINNKPHPDVYMICAKRFKKPPQSMRNVLVIEDNYDAVQGAIKAGMTTLLVPSVGWLEINDQNSNCDLVLQSLDRFQPQLFGLPCF